MHLDQFIFSALLLLAVTSVAVALFRRIGMGSVLGLLLAGVIVGPHSPGPDVTAHVDDVRNFAELGVVLLLFAIGLEIRPARLWSMRRELFGLGSLQILLTGLLLAVYLHLVGFTDSWGSDVLLGATLALSSTAFVMQLLSERGELASRHGSSALAILLMQDLTVVPLLAIVPLLSRKAAITHGGPLWEQLLLLAAMFAVLVILGRLVLPLALEWLARNENRDAFVLAVMLAVFFAAWAMHLSGLSMVLGAFIMGMLLSGSRFSMQIRAIVDPYKGLLMSLFFVAVGMSIDLGELARHPGEFVVHTLVLILIKIMVLLPLAWIFGHGRGDAIRLTLLLAQAGEFGFVVFGSAAVLDVIDDRTFVMAVSVISMSMLLTPVLMRAGHALAGRLERPAADPGSPVVEIPASAGRAVLIGGYGRMGHTVATLLQSSGIPFVAFDTNPERVAQGRSYGHAVHFGSVSDPALLAAVHAERSSLIVLTIDASVAATDTVSLLKSLYPAIPIIARAWDLEASGKLMEAGATEAYPEAIEASLRLGAAVLRRVGAPYEDVDLLIQSVRDRGYDLVS